MSELEATATGAVYPLTTPRATIEEGERNRAAFLAALRSNGGLVWKAREASGTTEKQYRSWRERHRGFRVLVEAIKDEFRQVQREEAGDTGPPDSFAAYRKKYFGFDSPHFHLEIIDALEHSEPGSVTLILMPPEHGKTTVLEDFCCYKLERDRNFRITIGSEKQTHGKKIISRVKQRMEPTTGPSNWIADCGPLAPPQGERHNQVWAEDRIHVYGRTSDERDYSIAAQGIGSSVVGSRADLLLIDDIQSLKSRLSSQDIFDNLTQDWLSRSGAFGRVVILGTRVSPDDVYSLLIESPIVNRVIEYAAYDERVDNWPQPEGANPKQDPAQIPSHVTTFLWPERYSPLNYLVMRVNAQESGWQRNYMQKAIAAGAQPFTTELLLGASRAQWSTTFLERLADVAGEIVVTLDPGFGVNCTMASLMTADWVMPIHWRIDAGLTNNQQIWQVVEEVIYTGQSAGHQATELVIEDKAFQKGLLDDEGLKSLKERHRFSVHGHQTGLNKYDPDLGIPQMPRALDRLEIILPGAEDLGTIAQRKLLDKQLIDWRPYKRGNRLTQDLVITLWFAWMTWRRVRRLLSQGGRDQQSWNTGALPSSLRVGASGLHLPTGGFGRG